MTYITIKMLCALFFHTLLKCSSNNISLHLHRYLYQIATQIFRKLKNGLKWWVADGGIGQIITKNLKISAIFQFKLGQPTHSWNHFNTQEASETPEEMKQWFYLKSKFQWGLLSGIACGGWRIYLSADFEWQTDRITLLVYVLPITSV